jgi:malate/lactate dehydrogenase
VNHGTAAGKPIREAIGDDEYLDGEFIATVQQRGAAIIAARKLSSALSAASSVGLALPGVRLVTYWLSSTGVLTAK